MTYKENVRAILESFFGGFKEGLIEAAAESINELDRTNGNDCYSRWVGNLYFGRYPKEARFICSACDSQTNIMTKYCPDCGRRMINPQESEE